MKTVRAVERALRVLFLVAESDRPRTLTDLSARLGLDKATALRLLFTLERAKLVRKDPRTRGYLPGTGILTLAHCWQQDLKNVSGPVLRRLAVEAEESVSLICARGLERVVIDVATVARELSVVPTIGATHPIYSGASGKVFMAFMSDDERDRVIRLTDLRPVSTAAIRDKGRYLKAIEEVRSAGYGFSSGDVTPGAAAIAAPIFKDSGLAGVVAVRGPAVRMSSERVETLVPVVVDGTNEISSRLARHCEDRATA